ncbi:acyltransferase family protein [Paraburkholderia sp.]|uniref:acyltransferase family protein n=1 Tax=Paraburkholderia sp. TaxID=1926495 RepID=UPI003D6E51C7
MDRDGRYQQLDALRGLAALTVVLSHFTLLAPLLGLRHSPVRLVSGGHEAVILFFALSGFVLTLQVKGSRGLRYGEYVVRRVCRIYLPYAGALTVAYACVAYCAGGPIDWAGPWFNSYWNQAPAAGDLIRHLLFILPFDTGQLDPVVWSLVYEMRISLIFMPVVLLVFRVPVWQTLTISALLSAAVCAYAVHTRHAIIQASIAAEWLPTLHYLLMFVAGAALAKHRGAIGTWFSYRTRGTAMSIFSASLALYVVARPLSMLMPDIIASDYLFDWIVLVAVCGIIACAVAVPIVERLFAIVPLPFLGRISYSLYLYNAIVLFAVVHIAGDRFGATMPLLIAAVLTIPVSHLAYLLVERPAIRLGSRLAGSRSVRRVLTDAAARN